MIKWILLYLLVGFIFTTIMCTIDYMGTNYKHIEYYIQNDTDPMVLLLMTVFWPIVSVSFMLYFGFFYIFKFLIGIAVKIINYIKR